MDDPLLELTPAPAVRPSDLQSTDDLLNSLDLAGSSGGSSDLDLDSGPDEDDLEESVEELEVLSEDAPEPVAPPPPARPGRTTLVKGPDESEDMRRRIGRPVQPASEAALDELSMDDEVEEIASFESSLGKGHSFTGLGDDGHKAAPGGDRPAASRPAPAPAPAPPPAPAPAPRADARPHLVPAPVNVPVEITASRNEDELTVPIEVTVGRPGTPTYVRLHIAVKIKLTD